MKGGFALPYLRGMFLVLPQLEVESYVESIGRPASFCREKEWMGVDIDRRRGQGKGRKEGGGSGEKKSRTHNKNLNKSKKLTLGKKLNTYVLLLLKQLPASSQMSPDINLPAKEVII